MEESGGISNKTFTLLILATLILSFGTSFYILNKSGVGDGKITGFVLAPNGTATLTVQTSSSIRFTADTVNFGTGSIDTANGFRNCSLSTVSGTAYANSGCTDFTEVNNGFTVENDGNTNLSVQLRTNQTAIQFIGSSGAMFRWNVTLNESGSCLNNTGFEDVVYPNTTADCSSDTSTSSGCGTIFESVSTSDKIICPRLRFIDNSDALNIDINLTIPEDTPAGVKLAGIIITGTRSPLT